AATPPGRSEQHQWSAREESCASPRDAVRPIHRQLMSFSSLRRRRRRFPQRSAAPSERQRALPSSLQHFRWESISYYDPSSKKLTTRLPAPIDASWPTTGAAHRMMPVPAESPFADWENFYVIVGSSAAALTGLQFVVIALIADAGAKTGGREIAAFGTPTVVHFCAALLASAIVSAPWRSLVNPAFAIGALGVAGVVYAVV